MEKSSISDISYAELSEYALKLPAPERPTIFTSLPSNLATTPVDRTSHSLAQDFCCHIVFSVESIGGVESKIDPIAASIILNISLESISQIYSVHPE